MSEIQAIIQEFKDALHLAPLPYLACSKFYGPQGKLSPICTHEDVAVIAASHKGPGSSNALTLRWHWRKSKEDSRITPDSLQCK